MSTSLYNLTAAMVALMESEETTNEQIEEVFGTITAKNNRIAFLRADLKGDIAKFKAEEERLCKIRKAMENKVARLEEYIQQSMESLAIDEIKTETFTFKLQNNPPAVQIDNEELIPLPYFTVIPVQMQLNKKDVAADIKAGIEVPGCSLITNKSLRIK